MNHQCATPEGTRNFRKRAETKVAVGHFKEFQDLQLCSLGMGTYLGEPDSQTDRLVEEAVKESIRSGAVNVIDTAINYRFQKAERSVGRAISDLIRAREIERSEVFVSTKNGYLTHDGDLKLGFWEYIHTQLIKPGIIGPDDIAGQVHCMSVPYLKDQLERSLRNLNISCIDLMYLHNGAESQIPDVGRKVFMERLASAFRFYEGERREGRIRFYGMATWTCFRTRPERGDHLNLEDVVMLARSEGGTDHGFRFVQLPFNLAMPEALRLKNQVVAGEKLSILEAAQRLGIRVFASIPLLQGELVRARDLPPIPGLKTPAQKAIQFVRSTPEGLIAPLVGQKKKEHVAENLEVARVPPMGREEFTAALKKAAVAGRNS